MWIFNCPGSQRTYPPCCSGSTVVERLTLHLLGSIIIYIPAFPMRPEVPGQQELGFSFLFLSNIFYFMKISTESTTTPRAISTAPVTRLSVLVLALFAITAAILAQMKVNTIQSIRTAKSGTPSKTK